ncbi:MAG: response regulator [Gemmatimonadaceae bacterium]
MARVLVVEDDLRLKMTYDILLKKEGHTVDRALNGEEALEKLASFKPDLILLDISMPKMNGMQFLEAARVRDNHPNLRIIVFSNRSSPLEMEKFFELGATKYMLKSSTSPKQLAALVQETLASK